MRSYAWTALYVWTLAATAFAASCPATPSSPAVSGAAGSPAAASPAAASPPAAASSGAAAVPPPPAASGSAPAAASPPPAAASAPAASGSAPAAASPPAGSVPPAGASSPAASAPAGAASGAPKAASTPAASSPASSPPAPSSSSSSTPPPASAGNSSKVVGGVYLINNDIEGNMIIGHNILSDGTIQYSQSTYAGGKGFADFTLPNGDFVALFSQASVQVHNGSLYTVNAASNTVAMFNINPENPTALTMVGQPADSGGIFPVSVGISKQTGNLCTINGGNDGSVQCYTTDKVNGLTAIPNTQRTLGLNQTAPPTGPGFTVSQVMFTDNGSRLLAAVKGSNATQTHGYILAWDVKTDGSLSQNAVKTPAGTGTEVFGMSQIPGTEAVISSDPSSGYIIYDYADGDVANTAPFSLPNQIDTCWTTWSARTGSYYLSDRLASTIFEVGIDGNLFGSNINHYGLKANSSLLDIELASLADNDYLYVLGAAYSSIYTLALNGPGQAQVIQTYNLTTPVTRSGVSVKGSNLAGMATYVIPTTKAA